MLSCILREVNSLVFLQDFNSFFVQLFILSLHVKDLEKTVSLPPIEIRVEHHQRLLALLNVFAKTALHLSVVV